MYNLQDSPPVLSNCVQYCFIPLTLDVQFQTNPTLSLQMITNQLKENNSRMTMICYQVFPSGRRFSQYQLINLVWLSVDFFPFSRRKPRPQSYFKILKTSFSPSSFSKKICWGQGWAEASLPAFSGLYNLAGAVVQKHHEEFFYLQLFTFLVLILQSTCFIYTFWKRKQNMEQQPHLACEWMKLKQKQSHFTFKLTTRFIALFSLQIM